MKILRIGILFILIVPVLTFAQAPDTLWTRTYGGSANDECNSIQQTADGGYIIGGATKSFGAGVTDFWLVKTDENGDSLWTRTFGGSSDDWCTSIQQTSDGGYILGGVTFSYGVGVADFWLVKTDANGDTLWSRTFGGSDDDWCFSVQQTSDGGYILGGFYSTGWVDDFWLVRTNANGDGLWSRNFGGSAGEHCQSVQQTSDGGYILGGHTRSYGAGHWDSWLVKTDAGGTEEWNRTFGGSSDEFCYSVQQTSDGGYILGGWTASYGAGVADFWLVKTNANGDSLWSRTFGGGDRDECYSMQQTSDGGYILGGYTQSYGAGGRDFWLVKTGPESSLQVVSPNGGEEWFILETDTVRWTGGGFGSNVKIEINRDYPEGVWEVLLASTENDSMEPVFIAGPISDNCRIAVSTLEGVNSDTSDGNFSIVSPQGYLALVRLSEPEIPVLYWDVSADECPDSVSETFYLKNFGGDTIMVFAPEFFTGPPFYSENDCPGFFSLLPGEMSVCSLYINYNPSGEGIHYDTLDIQSDAVNQQGGYVRIPLSGEQSRTPDTVEVVISIEGGDARLNWNPITVSIYGCPIDVTHYLVFYSDVVEGPYLYHGYTEDTTYVHLGVAHYEYGMFYNVTATTAPLPLLQSLPTNAGLTREEVLGMLKE